MPTTISDQGNVNNAMFAITGLTANSGTAVYTIHGVFNPVVGFASESLNGGWSASRTDAQGNTYSGSGLWQANRP